LEIRVQRKAGTYEATAYNDGEQITVDGKPVWNWPRQQSTLRKIA
jgi:hypothetical protein